MSTTRLVTPAVIRAITIVTALCAGTAELSGQGCMPLRFTSPSLGGQATTFLRPHEWQAGITGRRVATNKVFGGAQENEALAPGGQPLLIRLNSIDLSVARGMSERIAVTLTVPFSYSTASNFYEDGMRHQVSSTGIGDINAVGTFWLASPSQHPLSNAQLGIGFKAPTGSFHVLGTAYDADGNPFQAPIPQTVQLGDGGWSMPVQLQAFQRIASRVSVYASGVYSISLREHTDVLWPPVNTFWAVPDVYSARVGMGFALAPSHGLSVSLGGRVDGTTSKDLIGGSDDFYRHAGYSMYVEPGLSLVSGPNQFTLSVPVRVRVNYLNLVLSDGSVRPGLGGANDYVIYWGYTRRL